MFDWKSIFGQICLNFGKLFWLDISVTFWQIRQRLSMKICDLIWRVDLSKCQVIRSVGWIWATDAAADTGSEQLMLSTDTGSWQSAQAHERLICWMDLSNWCSLLTHWILTICPNLRWSEQLMQQQTRWILTIHPNFWRRKSQIVSNWPIEWIWETDPANGSKQQICWMDLSNRSVEWIWATNPLNGFEQLIQPMDLSKRSVEWIWATAAAADTPVRSAGSRPVHSSIQELQIALPAHPSFRIWKYFCLFFQSFLCWLSVCIQAF